MVLKEVIYKSIPVERGTVVINPTRGIHFPVDRSKDIKTCPECFNMVDSRISFVHDDEYYVTPFTEEKREALIEAGLVENRNLTVMFTAFEEPYDTEVNALWKELLEEARATYNY